MHPVARKVFAVPNGGRRSKIEASIMKGEGVRPGVPDLILPVARGGAHGFFLEMKAGDGRLSPQQLDRIAQLVDDGYCCVSAWGADAAIEMTKRYIAGSLPPDHYITRRSSPAASR